MSNGNILDPLFAIPILGLSSLSLAIIASTNPALFLSEFVFFIIGLALYYFFSKIDYRIYRNIIVPIYLFSTLALILVFFGPSVRGARRWIDFFGFRLQSSEIIKPFITILLAKVFSETSINTFKGFIKSVAIFLPLLLLIFKQPDLGNVIVFLGVFITMIIFAGLQYVYILSSLFLTTILLPFIWNNLHDYQKSRIFTFINPFTDPKGAGYNALQAIIAIGAGGFWGLGLGRGTQSHLLFLPEFHTDFAFASLVEEFGFLGGILVLGFYFMLLLKILFIAHKSTDRFSRYICVGIFSQLLLQVLINIGMNIGLLPITGITLPLLSYGGSSILSIFISLGVIISISRKFTNSPLVIG